MHHLRLEVPVLLVEALQLAVALLQLDLVVAAGGVKIVRRSAQAVADVPVALEAHVDARLLGDAHVEPRLVAAGHEIALGREVGQHARGGVAGVAVLLLEVARISWRLSSLRRLRNRACSIRSA